MHAGSVGGGFHGFIVGWAVAACKGLKIEAFCDASSGLEGMVYGDECEKAIVEPIFGSDAVVLVFAANERYVPYLSALLRSVVDHASSERFYDIVVLTTDISEKSQTLLRSQLPQEGMALRLFDMSAFSSWYENLYLRGHFRVETYYRLALQDIMPGYSKVLYLDSDMIVLDDVAKAFDVDVSGYLIAAVRDPDTAGLYNGYLPDKKGYMDDVLAMKDPFAYFQAGTILFNLDEFRRRFSVAELFDYAGSYEWELLDQDVLNHFCEGCVRFLDMRWNVMMDMEGIRAKDIIALAPQDLREAYATARKDPAIIHYAGPEKPWSHPECDFAEYFWAYAKDTPYYEVALARLCGDVATRRLKDEQRAAVERKERAKKEAEAAWKALRPHERVKERLYRASLALLPAGTARRSAFDAVRRRLKGRHS